MDHMRISGTELTKFTKFTKYILTKIPQTLL